MKESNSWLITLPPCLTAIQILSLCFLGSQISWFIIYLDNVLVMLFRHVWIPLLLTRQAQSNAWAQMLILVLKTSNGRSFPLYLPSPPPHLLKCLAETLAISTSEITRFTSWLFVWRSVHFDAREAGCLPHTVNEEENWFMATGGCQMVRFPRYSFELACTARQGR